MDKSVPRWSAVSFMSLLSGGHPQGAQWVQELGDGGARREPDLHQVRLVSSAHRWFASTSLFIFLKIFWRRLQPSRLWNNLFTVSLHFYQVPSALECPCWPVQHLDWGPVRSYSPHWEPSMWPIWLVLTDRLLVCRSRRTLLSLITGNQSEICHENSWTYGRFLRETPVLGPRRSRREEFVGASATEEAVCQHWKRENPLISGRVGLNRKENCQRVTAPCPSGAKLKSPPCLPLPSISSSLRNRKNPCSSRWRHRVWTLVCIHVRVRCDKCRPRDRPRVISHTNLRFTRNVKAFPCSIVLSL